MSFKRALHAFLIFEDSFFSVLVRIMFWPSVVPQKILFQIFLGTISAHNVNCQNWNYLGQKSQLSASQTDHVPSSHGALPTLPGHRKKGWLTYSGKQRLMLSRISATSLCSQMVGEQNSQKHASAGMLASPSALQALCSCLRHRQQLVSQGLGERRNKNMMPLLNEFSPTLWPWEGTQPF